MSDRVTDRSLLSGRVQRYNTWPTIGTQTVGDHTWGVYHVYWRIFGLPSAEVALYIHLHDAEELVGGDNPFPSKRRFPRLKEAMAEVEHAAREQLRLPQPEEHGVTEEERVRVKVCDLLEMMHFGMLEREMGNLLATPIVERTRNAAIELSKASLPVEQHKRVCSFVYAERERHAHTLKKEGSTR